MSTRGFLFHEDLIKRWMLDAHKQVFRCQCIWLTIHFLTSSGSVVLGLPVPESLGLLAKVQSLGVSSDSLNQSFLGQLWTPDFPPAH